MRVLISETARKLYRSDLRSDPASIDRRRFTLHILIRRRELRVDAIASAFQNAFKARIAFNVNHAYRENVRTAVRLTLNTVRI